jgi:hypothetical protein
MIERRRREMDEENKNRINVDDLPRDEEELTSEEAKEVQGGLTGSNTWGGPITLGSTSTIGSTTVGGALSGNTVGGSLNDTTIDPIKR